MRRHAKASSAGSTEGSGNSRGLFRRAFATRGVARDAKGSGAPSGRAARFGLAALLALVLAAFLAPSALAIPVFGSPTKIAGEGTGNGELGQFPGRAAVEQATGNLFVADQTNNRVQVFKPNGSDGADYLTQFGSGELSSPWGIAIDENAGQTFVYVADAGHNRILKYASDEAATPSFTVVGSGSFDFAADKVGNFKAALAVDPTTHDLLVADKGNNLIERFEANGSFVSPSFDGAAGAGSPGAFKGLLDVTVNSTGDIYVIDADGTIEGQPDDITPPQGTSQALRYSAAGSYKATLSPVGPHQRPATVAVNPASDEVVVSGYQDAIYDNESPTLRVFDSADNPLSSPIINDQYGSVSGLAIASGSAEHLYVVLYPGLYEGNPYSGNAQIQAFKKVEPPTVTIAPASNVGGDSVVVNGSVNPMGTAITTCRFEYSTDTSFADSVPCAEKPGAGTSSVSVHAKLTGLSPESAYNFRLVVENSAANVTSPGETFTTLHVDPPTATIDPPTVVGPYALSVSGAANPHAGETTARFEYSADDGATWTQLPQLDSSDYPALAYSTSPVAIADEITGLESNTTYEVRLSVANLSGAAQSSIQSATTAGAAPKVQTLSPAQTTDTSALLRGRINPGNQATTYRFEIGTSTGYGRVVPLGPEASVGSGGAFTTALSNADGLTAGTTYHYRLVATNATGTTFGGDRSFTTRATRPACSNEAFRTGLAANLTECRAYEMVSPPGKNGGDIDPDQTVQTSASGDGAIFSSTVALPGAESSLLFNYFGASRGAGQWSSVDLEAPQFNPGKQLFYTSPATSADLSKTMQVSLEALAPGAVQGNGNIYLQDNETKTRTLIATGPPSLYFNATGGGGKIFYDATPDLSHILFVAPEKLTPDALEGGGIPNLYEWSEEDGLRVVNELPDGTIAPKGSTTGAPRGRSISNDGKRIAFRADTGGGNQPLYVRENGNVTKAISVSQRSGDSDEPQSAGLQTITADGSYVFFTSSRPLTEDSTSQGFPDLYRYDLDSGDLEDLSVPLAAEEQARVQAFLAASPSGDRAYYLANGVMASGAVSGFGNIYEWHNGVTHLVASLNPSRDYNEAFNRNVSMSSSGNHFSFMSVGEPTGYDNHGANCKLSAEDGDGKVCSEVYTYDSATQDLQCVSCNFAAAPQGDSAFGSEFVTVSGYKPRTTLDDGRVFFDTKDSLSPQDTNGRIDVYQWDAGEVTLISSGTSTADSTFKDASADGSNVFFATSQRLVPQDVDANVDLYDARVDGGLAAQQIDPELEGGVCGGETCRTAAGGAPPGAGPATNAFEGPPNKVTPRKQCPKTRKGKGSKAKNSKAKCRKTGGKEKAKKKSAKRAGGANSRSGK